ncbi:MAG: hypothetical protein J5666_00960, partial [Bacilli bacterium]|nr:hypothetical protein [Bacilli bacterium]
LFVKRIKLASIKLVTAGVFDLGVMVVIGVLTAGTFEKKYPKVIEVIIDALNFVNAPKSDICPASGIALDDENSTTTFYNNIKITVSKEGLTKYNESITHANEEFKSEPNNYLKGFLGIFLGGIAGVLATILFSLMGIISAVSAFISVFFGIFLYKKFGGKPNWVMIVMSFITTLVFIMGYILYAYIVYSVTYLADLGIIKAGIDALKYCLANYEEVAKSFRYDMILNLVFCTLGIIASISYAITQSRRPKQLKK